MMQNAATKTELKQKKNLMYAIWTLVDGTLSMSSRVACSLYMWATISMWRNWNRVSSAISERKNIHGEFLRHLETLHWKMDISVFNPFRPAGKLALPLFFHSWIFLSNYRCFKNIWCIDIQPEKEILTTCWIMCHVLRFNTVALMQGFSSEWYGFM